MQTYKSTRSTYVLCGEPVESLTSDQYMAEVKRVKGKRTYWAFLTPDFTKLSVLLKDHWEVAIAQ